jgi:hypothetical protein
MIAGMSRCGLRILSCAQTLPVQFLHYSKVVHVAQENSANFVGNFPKAVT